MDPRFRGALDATLAALNAMPEVKGILFFGSVQRGETTPSSDLDLFMVAETNETWSARRLVGDVEVEVYFAPARQWRKDLENCNVTSIKAFGTGSILLDQTGELAELVSIGQRLYAEGPAPLEPLQQGNWRIRLSDLIRDLEGVPTSSAEARLIGGLLVSQALEAYCAFNRLWPEKPDKLIRRVAAHDAVLGERASAYFRDCMSPAEAIAVADCVLAPVGGRLLLYEGPHIPC